METTDSFSSIQNSKSHDSIERTPGPEGESFLSALRFNGICLTCFTVHR